MSGAAWSAADEAILRELFADGDTAEIAAALGRTVSATHQKAQKLGLAKRPGFVADLARERMTPDHPARATAFKWGQAAWNAGLHYEPGGRSAETRFQPGDLPQTWQPIGTRRFDKDGLLVEKVTDTRSKSDWVPLHRLAWERANGAIPPGHIVVFKEGRRTTDPEHITADAVECITRAELMRRNTYHRFGPEIAKVYQLRGAINRQINKRAKEQANG